MREILVLVIHLLVTLATLLRSGDVRIAQQIAQTFGVEIDKDVVRRVLAELTPTQFAGALSPVRAALDHCGWQQHRHALFELPIAV